MVSTRVQEEICGTWRNSEGHTEKSLVDHVRIKENAEESIDVYEKKRFVFQVTEIIRSVEQWL